MFCHAGAAQISLVPRRPFYDPAFRLAGFGDSILNCRDCDSANRVHPECWPISVPQNDPYFPPVNVSSGRPFCIAFTRSLPGQQTLGESLLPGQHTLGEFLLPGQQTLGEFLLPGQQTLGE